MSTTEAPAQTKCAGTSKKTGEQCPNAPVRGLTLCAGHAGLGKLDPAKAQQRSLEVRRERAEAKKMGFTDHLSAKLARDADQLAEQWIREGHRDYRATEAALTRLYGKPKETLEVSGGLDLTALSSAERGELVRRALADQPAVLEALPEQYRARLNAGPSGI